MLRKVLLCVYGVAIPFIGSAGMYFLIWLVSATMSLQVDPELRMIIALASFPVWAYASYLTIRRLWN